jgi:long-chain fatty acid transport protein
MKKIIRAMTLSFLLIGISLGGGFELYEFGAAASALSGAVVARTWDASTVFYNPAGIAFLEGTHFYGGLTLIFPKTKFTGAEPIFAGEEHNAKDLVHHPIGIYFTHQFTEDLFAGIGVTNPFGLGLAWEKDFPGRGLSFNTDLKSFYVSPVVAYKLSDNFSISGGLDLVFGNVILERSAFLFTSEGSPGTEVGDSKVEGTSDLAAGFTASLMYRDDNLGLGFLYRHSIENKLSAGDASFNLIDTGIPGINAMAAGLLVDQKVNTSLSFPNFFVVGAYYKLMDNLGLEVDYSWYNWSVFDELVLEFDDPLLNQTVPQDYENSNQIRLGVHYDLSKNLQLRTGYIWDESPQPVHSISPLLADNDRNDYTLGLGYTMNNWQFDVGYMLVDFGERSTVVNGVGQNENGFDGSYATIAHLFFFSFGIKIN